MNTKTRKLIISAALLFAVVTLGAFAYRAEQPYPKEANPDWIRSVSGTEVVRESVMFESGSLSLEGDLILPAGGAVVKPAVVFVAGSGDSLYQNYSPGVVETYVQDVFLPRDIAVFYYNKRGMGQSEGSWLNSDFQGRADDTYAAVEFLRSHPAIDPVRIGVIGHSQGGWIANLTAAQHDEIAFFISLAGPTTSVEDNMRDNYRGFLMCENGLRGEELGQRIERQLRLTRLGAAIGRVFPIGIIGFDTHIIDNDPAEAIKSVSAPGLFVYGEHDTIVFAGRNKGRFYEIFEGNPPEHLQIAVIPQATHIFRVTPDLCTSREDSLEMPLSEDLVQVLESWLSGLGY